MGATLVGDVANQVQKFWSPLFTDELKEVSLLGALVNKDYQGDIKREGDTVYVSQINRPTATRKSVGSGHEYFDTNKLSTSRVSITANQVISAAYEFDDLVQLQSQIGSQDSAIRRALLESLDIELNNYLYEIVSPSTSSPDHLVSGVSDFNASQLNGVRKLASQAKWSRDGGWWLLADPSYESDLLNAATLTSIDYADEKALVGGQFAQRKFGFNILEDNSAGLISAMQRLGSSVATEDAALAFHPDFLHLVMQQEPFFDVAPLTSNKQFGYVIVVKMVVGAALGIDGNLKHVFIYNS